MTAPLQKLLSSLLRAAPQGCPGEMCFLIHFVKDDVSSASLRLVSHFKTVSACSLFLPPPSVPAGCQIWKTELQFDTEMQSSLYSDTTRATGNNFPLELFLTFPNVQLFVDVKIKLMGRHVLLGVYWAVGLLTDFFLQVLHALNYYLFIYLFCAILCLPVLLHVSCQLCPLILTHTSSLSGLGTF